MPALAQVKPKNAVARSISYSVPYGYSQVGDTRLYYRQNYDAIDIVGDFGGQYYGSTYADRGYRLAMQVDGGSATSVDCLNGTTVSGVTCMPTIEQQGELARICYTVTNTNTQDVTLNMGVHADVMIGNNDHAPITRRTDTTGSTYGLTMRDGNGAQLCVLFGAGLAGVTSVNDFWFGHYSLNYDAYNMVGNYYSGSYYMVENGSYDSGMGWCWKNRTIPAGATMVYSFLIGVGEVNLEPNSSFEVTPDDPEGWNDLSRPHKLTLEGTYESPAGLDGMIEYAVEDSEEWIAMTDMMPSGSAFNDSIVAMFDTSREKHVIRFRTRDNVGNTTLLPSIEYIDVSFHDYAYTADTTYCGQAIVQEVVCTDVEGLQVTTDGYLNNVNAGTASFNVEGVFPHTIGRKPCTFRINPAPLAGELELATDYVVYNGQEHRPGWSFTHAPYNALVEGTDFTAAYTDNILPGTATLTVTGMGNYTSSLSRSFIVDKAPLSDTEFTVMLPDVDVSYDGNAHAATANVQHGVGTVTFTYQLRGGSAVSQAPVEAGTYDIYMTIADGELYYGRPAELVGSFTIYRFDEAEWQALNALYAELQQMGVTLPWDLTQGIKMVSTFVGLTIKEGHLTGVTLKDQSLSGLFAAALAAFSRLEVIDLSGNNLSGDLPTVVAALKAQLPQAFSSLKVLNLSHNRLSGNAGVLGYAIPTLTSLNLSHNKFEDLYPALPATVTQVDLSHQDMDRVVELNMSDLSLDDMATTVPSILLYDHSTRSYKNAFNLLCTKADLDHFDKYTSDDWAMQLRIDGEQISIPYVSAQNAYHGESGDTLNVLNMIDDDTTDGSRFRIRLSFNPGDANFVNGVDATDLQATILYAFGTYRNYPFNFTAANTYRDELINVQDVVCTVNLLLDAAPEQPSEAPRRVAGAASDEPAEATLSLRNGQIILHSRIPVASLSIKAEGDIRWNLDALGMQQATAGGNVVAYSLDGVTLPCLEEVVIGEYSRISLQSASLSDAQAQAISVGLGNGVTTGISDARDQELEGAEIYSIAGYRMNRPESGVQIIRRNGKSQKIYKK